MMNNELDFPRQLLIDIAKKQQLLSYKEFARLAGITRAPIIQQVSSLLESLMAGDKQMQRPLFSALVVAKSGNIPRPGFFIKLHQLGLTKEVLEGEQAVLWHQAEVEKIFRWVKNNDE